MPIDLDIQWIKGHQDQNKNGQVIHGPFKQEVHMNMLVDELAAKGMKYGNDQINSWPNLSTSVLSVYDKRGVSIQDV